jgi:hypothetical protein
MIHLNLQREGVIKGWTVKAYSEYLFGLQRSVRTAWTRESTFPGGNTNHHHTQFVVTLGTGSGSGVCGGVPPTSKRYFSGERRTRTKNHHNIPGLFRGLKGVGGFSPLLAPAG